MAKGTPAEDAPLASTSAKLDRPESPPSRAEWSVLVLIAVIPVLLAASAFVGVVYLQ